MQLGLEPPLEGFSVDTSSFMSINENYEGEEREAVWQRLFELIQEGRIKVARLVMVELTRNDPDAARRLAPLRGLLVVSDRELATVAGRTARQFPKMSRPWPVREKADPWVVALGQVRSLTVVSREGGAPGKIPATCKALELDCIKLGELLGRTEVPR